MADPSDKLLPQQLRASDQDRERIAEVLRAAAADGRLDLDEVDERLSAVYAARTYADLEPLVRDLPSPSTAPVPMVGTPRPLEPAHRGWAVAVLSGTNRRGPWVPPTVLTCLAFWGGGTVDLREARFRHGEMKIRIFALMGGFKVIVPDSAEVHVTGVGLMGGFADNATRGGRYNGPRITVTGFTFWGGAQVIRKSRKRKHRPEDDDD